MRLLVPTEIVMMSLLAAPATERAPQLATETNRGELVLAAGATWPGPAGNTRVYQVSANFRMSSRSPNGLVQAVPAIRLALAATANILRCLANVAGRPPVCGPAAPEPRDIPAKPEDRGRKILLLEFAAMT